VWAFLLDIPRVGKCSQVVERVESLGDNRYKCIVKTRVGPVGADILRTYEGTMTIVEADEQAGRGAMTAEGGDESSGGTVRGKMTMSIREVSANATELTVDTDANIIGGRLCELGGAVIKRKADRMMEQFAKNIIYS